MKKLISLVLVLAALLSLGSVAFAAGTFTYTDYTPNDWYFRYVEKAIANGWMNGVGGQDFDPNGTLNRSMFVTILHRIAGSPAPAKAAAFSDVVKGAWYENAVSWAAENGVVTGYEDGRFGVSDPLTREQMAAILFRYATKDGAPVTLEENLTGFSDNAEISSYAVTAMNWAVGQGILAGSGTALMPKGTSTRAQAATVLVRFDAREEAATLTRADLEKAVVELNWAYSLKDNKIQYDSQNMTSETSLLKYHSGTYRVTEDVAPEYGNDDTAIFSVCSDYCQKSYYNALNERLLGFPTDWVTRCLWGNTENVYNGKDIVVARYWDDARIDSGHTVSVLKTTPHRMTSAEMRAFFQDWKNTMRPGDIMVPNGHAMMYIGNGYVLDCAGDKYELSTGMDAYEAKGAVSKLRGFEDCYVNGTESKNSWWFPAGEEGKSPTFAVLRPIDALVVKDGDNDPGNDKAIDGVTITPATRTRMQYPGMDIRHSADVSALGTLVSGGNVTYKVDIYNKTTDSKYLQYRQYAEASYAGQDYKGIAVSEPIPAGTEFVSATEGGKLVDGKVVWTVDVAAGQMKSLQYTVKVTAPAGSTVVCEGGFVGNIPAKVLTNKVGGQKLTDADRKTLAEFYDQYGQDWVETYGLEITDNTSAVEQVYRKVLGKKLELDTVEELFGSIYEQKQVSQRISTGYERGKTRTGWMYTPVEGVYEKHPMLVRNYLGGTGTWFENDQDRVNEFDESYLEPGDIVFHVNLSKYDASGKARTVTGAKIMLWLGDEKYAIYDTAAKTFLRGEGTAEQWRAWQYGAFFVLRPSQDLKLEDSGEKVTPMSVEQAEAESRKKFPGIEITRTTSAGGRFASTVKDAELTITGTVENGGTAAYPGLDISENIPVSTTLKTAEGAKQDGGKLLWTVDVPAGKTVSVTYTVKVGDATALELNGKVDNIPNATTILPVSKDLMNAKNVARIEKLRGMTGEEILKELGTTGKRALDQIRITYGWICTGKGEKIHSKMSSGIRGLGDTRNLYQAGGKNDKGLYTLAEKTAMPAPYNSTLVEGFWGGSEMDTTGSAVYNVKPTAEDFTIGDLLVKYDGTGVIYDLYLGEGKFLSMYTGDPDGTAPAHKTAQEVIDSCFTENIKFFCLQRISLMYAASNVK